MHGLVGHELLEHERRRLPGDPPQFQEAGVEPALEQPVQFDLQHFERGLLRQQSQQVGAQIDEELHAFRQQVELHEELRARGVERYAQPCFRAAQLRVVGRNLHGGDGLFEPVAIGRKLVRDEIEDGGALRQVRAAVERCDFRGPLARGNLAAAPRPALIEQFPEPLDETGGRAIGPGRAAPGKYRRGKPAPPVAHPLESRKRVCSADRRTHCCLSLATFFNRHHYNTGRITPA